jgi:hypothetical protein
MDRHRTLNISSWLELWKKVKVSRVTFVQKASQCLPLGLISHLWVQSEQTVVVLIGCQGSVRICYSPKPIAKMSDSLAP